MRTREWLAAALLVAGAASGGPAASPAESVSRCGHVEELLAAKAALARGDDEAALRHLEAADALLARCERDGIPVETEPETGAIETGRAPGSASAS